MRSLQLSYMSRIANNALLGGGVRVRVWIREQRKIKRRSKVLLSLCWQSWTSLAVVCDQWEVYSCVRPMRSLQLCATNEKSTVGATNEKSAVVHDQWEVCSCVRPMRSLQLCTTNEKSTVVCDQWEVCSCVRPMRSLQLCATSEKSAVVWPIRSRQLCANNQKSAVAFDQWAVCSCVRPVEEYTLHAQYLTWQFVSPCDRQEEVLVLLEPNYDGVKPQTQAVCSRFSLACSEAVRQNLKWIQPWVSYLVQH